jgi:hypothetical protein
MPPPEAPPAPFVLPPLPPEVGAPAEVPPVLVVVPPFVAPPLAVVPPLVDRLPPVDVAPPELGAPPDAGAAPPCVELAPPVLPSSAGVPEEQPMLRVKAMPSGHEATQRKPVEIRGESRRVTPQQ